jgi:predicted HD phosphohydrolase
MTYDPIAHANDLDDLYDADLGPKYIDRSKYDTRHGGPFDRGAADNYYRRPFSPHYYEGATYSGDRIVPAKDTPEYAAYTAGWDWNEWDGDKKDWG